MTEIVTPRLVLRRAVPGDLAAVHAIMSDVRAMRYWSTGPHTSLEATRAWFAPMLAPASATADEFVITLAGQVIGKVGLWRIPELGFLLHPDHWRRGYGVEATTALVSHAFAAHPIQAITADVDPRNEASLALLAQLGFVETGRAHNTIEVDGAWCDSVYLALSRPA